MDQPQFTRNVLLTVPLVASMACIMLSDKHCPDFALLGLLTILAAAQVVSIDDALSGFSSPSVATLLVSSCLASAISTAKSTQALLRAVLGDPANTPAAQVRLLLLVTVASAFLDDAALVALLVPLVTRWAAQRGLAPGQLLLPLSFGALLGGNLTLMGNPANLLLAGLANERLAAHDRPPLGLFEVATLGVPLALWGAFCIVFFSPLMLPGYDDAPAATAEREQFLLGLRVAPSSARVVGATIQGAGLRHLRGVYLVALRRGGSVVHAVPPSMHLAAGDVLYFTGQTQYVQAVAREYGLEFVSEALGKGDVRGALLGMPGPRRQRRPSAFAAAVPKDGSQTTTPTSAHGGGVEDHEDPVLLQQRGALLRMVVRTDAPLINAAVRDVDFVRRFHAVLLGISKGGRLLGWPLGDVRFEAGDRLLCSVGGGWWTRCARDAQGCFQDVRPVGQQARVFTFALEYQQPNLLGVRARDVVAPLPYITLTGVESAQHVRDAPDHLVMEGDRLWLCGTVEGLLAAQGLPQVAIVDVRSVSKASVEQHLVQVVLAAKGGLLGKTVRDVRFRTEYHAAIIAVYRGGRPLQGRLGDVVLAAGDTLLLDSTPAFVQRAKGDPHFALVTEVTDADAVDQADGKDLSLQSLLPMTVTAAALFANALGALDLLVALTLALGVLLWCGVVRVDTLAAGVRLEGLLMTAAALGVSKALEASGLPALLTWALSGLRGEAALVGVVYLLTVLLSQVVSATAVVSCVFPIAAQLAQQQGVSVRVVAMALMLAGSAVFTSPLLYETNVIVLGAGGYRMADMLRFGAVMQVWQAVGALTLLSWHQYWPVFWGVLAQASLVVLLGAPALASSMGFGHESKKRS